MLKNKLVKIGYFLLFLCFLFLPLYTINWLNEMGAYPDFYCLYDAFNHTNPYDQLCFVYLNYFHYMTPFFYLERTSAILISSALNLIALI